MLLPARISVQGTCLTAGFVPLLLLSCPVLALVHPDLKTWKEQEVNKRRPWFKEDDNQLLSKVSMQQSYESYVTDSLYCNKPACRTAVGEHTCFHTPDSRNFMDGGSSCAHRTKPGETIVSLFHAKGIVTSRIGWLWGRVL